MGGRAQLGRDCWHHSERKRWLPPQEEFLLSRDLDDVKQFMDQFGVAAAAEIRDDNGNTALRVLCGNGHPGCPFKDIFDYLLPPSHLLSFPSKQR
ncbi:Ankyrin repeat-containing protein P16F5,05c [Mycena venus]|uniref:Ankyrin repeat-containing protein P16F5,05c n=1 Tax=Mycena venus TaxID=2733690 RepID=A0A8H7D501_9AGAR|nr:Ankyrin repeat-containing protein P16F5,05c [Mycena venus]